MHLDVRSLSSHRPTRAAVRPAMLALGLAIAGAAPATAACKGAELKPVDSVSLGGSTWSVRYKCWNSCGVTSSSGPLIEEVTLIGRYDMLHCRSRCSARNDCYAVSYHDTTVVVDGREERARVCRLWGRGEVETVNVSPVPGRPYDFQVVCVKNFDPTLPWQRGLDLDKFQQDQQRPGVPGPSVPTKP